MRCPRCQQALLPEGDLWTCPTAHGAFADAATLRMHKPTQRVLLDGAAAPGTRECPYGTHQMDTVAVAGDIVDVCPCGAWFDPGEHQLLRRTTPIAGDLANILDILEQAFWIAFWT